MFTRGRYFACFFSNSSAWKQISITMQSTLARKNEEAEVEQQTLLALINWLQLQTIVSLFEFIKIGYIIHLYSRKIHFNFK